MSNTDNNGPDIVIHLDLNKSILAVDEVKNYGRTEVVYLEQWKNDPEFLKWAYTRHKDGDAPEVLDMESWIAELKLSKNEPTLILYARDYVSVSAERKAMMQGILSKVDDGNCVQSFWELCDWAKTQTEKRVLICFRTFGCDLPNMYSHLEASGYGDHLVRDEATGKGKVWTMLHKTDASKGFSDEWLDPCDVVDGFIQPGNPTPGPKLKGTEEFNNRTVKLEDHAKALFEQGGALEPVVYTQMPEVSENKLQAFTNLDSDKIHPITHLNTLLAGTSFGKQSLRIMGMQDNYKPWSRKNPLNGKIAVIDPDSPFKQLFFDDYSFTKASEQGTYIWALYDKEGNPISGTKEELQAVYSAEEEFRESSTQPCIFTVVLNKKGQTETAIQDPAYFVKRVSDVLSRGQL